MGRDVFESTAARRCVLHLCRDHGRHLNFGNDSQLEELIRNSVYNLFSGKREVFTVEDARSLPWRTDVKKTIEF